MAIINTPETNLAVLDNLILPAGPLGHVKYHLFKNDFQPQKTTPKDAYVEADFPGYASSASITWNAPYLDATLNANVLGQEIQFTLSSDSVTQTVYGYFAVGTQGSDSIPPGTTLLYGERFAQPVALIRINQAVPLVPAYQFGQ